MTVTTEEAATMVGVSAVTVRRWVMKGWLIPVPVFDPSRTWHLFIEGDVVACEHQHRPAWKRAAFTRAQIEWRALLQTLDK